MLAAVADQSQVAEVRRIAADMARDGGFDETAAGRVALVATELATNLLKHAGGGDMLVQRFAEGESAGIELLALDKGPGIGDLRRALDDGYSTAGSPGNGLGAIRRQSDEFAIWSRSGLGTAIVARIGGGAAARRAIIGAVTHPFRERPSAVMAGASRRFKPGRRSCSPTVRAMASLRRSPRRRLPRLFSRLPMSMPLGRWK